MNIYFVCYGTENKLFIIIIIIKITYQESSDFLMLREINCERLILQY